MTERERFEDWATSIVLNLRKDGFGYYIDGETRTAWLSWNASIVIWRNDGTHD